ncbi:histidine kinase [Actinomadura livida]|uniref:Histidine kinase n=1 Tax=Actinomadura livida TaxID=79909 RepID=A0ABN1DN36_9ACTN|nr:two-component sensor histidine kinase [Actinomadura livida]
MVTARHSIAERIEAERSTILAEYLRALRAEGSSIVNDPLATRQALAHADQAITDVVRSVRAGRVQVNENAQLLARNIGEARAAKATPARESWQAAMILMETVVRSAARHLESGPLDTYAVVLLALTRSITVGIREATGAYMSYLLSRIHEAHIGERRRIARELHDRVGNGLGVAHRQLELFGDVAERVPVAATNRLERAQEAVVEAMENLRGLMLDLRLDNPQSLEKALTAYIESIPKGDGTLTLRVTGDETWLPDIVRDESFLIIREAIRNALAHGEPDLVLINVYISPDELRAVVKDDGIGFEPTEQGRSDGTGLASMTERAALLDGSLTVLSERGKGTQVELLARFPPERREDPVT